jgi:general secretion pathway protein A
VRHRLRVAGQRQRIFTLPAMSVIHRRSGGVPRVINNICDRALLGAFGRSKRRVTAATARRAAVEVSGSGRRRRWLQPVIVGILLVAVMGATMLRLESTAMWWRPHILPVPVGRSTATVADTPSASVAAVVAPAPWSSLARLLDATTVDRDSALAALFARWGVDFQPRPGDSPCEIARRSGLRCIVRSGTWNVIRRLDVPAILTLMTSTGERHYVTVTALGVDTVTLNLSSRVMTLPLHDVERFWDGAFVALWRTPNLSATALKPGDGLRQRVLAFQRANGLRADGVLGEETLLRLAATTPGPSPSLSKVRP